mgnify:CR=1 FL=1
MSQRLDGVPRLSDGTPWAPVGFGSLRRRSLARFSWIVTSWLCAGSLSGCLDRSGKPGFLEVTPPSMEFLVRLRSDGSEHKPLEATFQVKNGGGRPVNILRIEKSCGCTQPRIAPSSQIAPSQWARLIAMVDPPLHGERRVELTLTTDSPITPRVLITITIQVERTPPYLTNVLGDLSFRSRADFLEGRTLEIHGITTKGDERDPVVECNLTGALLQQVSAHDVGESRDANDLFHFRIWRYSLSFPTESLTGEAVGFVRILDPWNPLAPVRSLGVSLSPEPDFVVVPQRLVFKAHQREARLLVRGPDQVVKVTARCSTNAIEVIAVAESGQNSQMLLLRRRLDRELRLGIHEVEVVASTVSSTWNKTVPIRVVED